MRNGLSSSPSTISKNVCPSEDVSVASVVKSGVAVPSVMLMRLAGDTAMVAGESPVITTVTVSLPASSPGCAAPTAGYRYVICKMNRSSGSSAVLDRIGTNVVKLLPAGNVIL